jgi:hypothetical protein
MRRRAQGGRDAVVGVTDLPVATSSAITSTSAKPSGKQRPWRGGVGVAEFVIPSRFAATCTPPRVSIDVADFAVLASFATTPMRPRRESAGKGRGRNGMNDARDGVGRVTGEEGAEGLYAVKAPGTRTHSGGLSSTTDTTEGTIASPASHVGTLVTHTFTLLFAAPLLRVCV